MTRHRNPLRQNRPQLLGRYLPRRRRHQLAEMSPHPKLAGGARYRRCAASSRHSICFGQRHSDEAGGGEECHSTLPPTAPRRTTTRTRPAMLQLNASKLVAQRRRRTAIHFLLTPSDNPRDDCITGVRLQQANVNTRRPGMSEIEFLKLQHELGRISRREFLGRAVASGASAALLTTVTNIEASAAEMPRKGGKLRLGVGGGSTTDTLDPTAWTDTAMVVAGSAHYNALVEPAPDRSSMPELAESWEAKPGAAQWVFNLRKGVTFHNGKTFDADDAIYSINLHRGNTKSGAAGSFKEITDVKKLTPNQILVTLASGDGEFPAVLTDYHAKMVPDGFKDWAHAIGTGGYTVDHFDAGVRATGKRFANYWKPGRANVDSFDITVINDNAARMNAMVSGQVDVINRVDPKTAALMKRRPGVSLVVAAGGWHALLSMLQDKPPFQDRNLRLALKYSVDRAQIVKTLFSGYGSVGNDHPISRSDKDYNNSLPQIAYDPEKVKFYLKKSGFSDAILLQASDAAFNGAVDMGTLCQASAAKAGLKINVKKEPADGFWDNVWLKGSCVTSYWAGRTTATQILAVAYGADAPWNESHYQDPKFTAALTAAKSELDNTKRKQLVFECQRLLNEDGATVVPAFRDYIDAHNDKVGGHTPHSLFDMDNGYIIDKAWLKA